MHFADFRHDEFSVDNHEQDSDHRHAESPIVEVLPQTEEQFPPLEFILDVAGLPLLVSQSVADDVIADDMIADVTDAGSAADSTDATALSADAAADDDAGSRADAAIDDAASTDDRQARTPALVRAAGTRSARRDQRGNRRRCVGNRKILIM